MKHLYLSAEEENEIRKIPLKNRLNAEDWQALRIGHLYTRNLRLEESCVFQAKALTVLSTQEEGQRLALANIRNTLDAFSKAHIENIPRLDEDTDSVLLADELHKLQQMISAMARRANSALPKEEQTE